MVKWDAEDYSRNSTAQMGWARELIGKLRLTGSERVLDIGCGDGKVSAEIAQLVPGGQVVGIDSSEDMVRFASSSFPGDQWPNLSFSHVDARHLDLCERFDVVFSNATLHWVIDHAPVVRAIGRALKPGGRMLLQMGGKGNASEIQAAFDGLRVGDRWARYFEGFTHCYGFYGPEDYEGWLQGSGLRPVRVELIPKDMTQQGREGLTGWVRTTWLPYTQRVPEHLRGEFVDEVVDEYLQLWPPDADGTVHVRMVRLEVEAEKKASRSAINGLWILG